MEPLFYLVNTILTLCIDIVIIRLWMQFTRVNYHNQLTQIIIKITQPIIGPLRKIIPSVGRVDSATVLVLYLISLLKLCFIIYMLGYSIQPIFLLYALLVIIHGFGHLIFWLLLIRAILSWVSQGRSALDEVLYQLTEPLVQPIRRVIPPIGNIDLSFMIFMFILILLNMVAMVLFKEYWAILSI